MDAIKIRGASVEDASPLAGLATQLGYPTSPIQAAFRLPVLLASSEHAILVACLPDVPVVGWVHVFQALRMETDPSAELGGFVAAAVYRRRGIGQCLLAAAEKWAVQRGIQKLRVRSRLHRADAHAFYERLGFSSSKQQEVSDKALPIHTG